MATGPDLWTDAPLIQPEELVTEKDKDHPNQDEKIGSGSYGIVYRGYCRGKEVAIKRLLRQDFPQLVLKEFEKEVKICCSLSHPNILLFMGACIKMGDLAIVTEYMPNGNLETVLKDHQIQLSDRLKLKMARDCALGMNWLHKATPPILHRDLKPPNLLVDKDYGVKVCDFGLSCIRETDVIKDKDKVPGTPLFMSPEVLTKGNINEKCDVYSFGILLWQIMTRQDPFPEFHDFNEFRSAICRKNVRPPIPSSIAQSVKSIMERSWHKDPSTRPSFEELIPLLERAILEVTIEENHSRKFWEDHGWGEEAPWKHFSDALSLSLGLGKEAPDTIEWRVLKHLLTVVRDKNKVEPEHVVTQEKFGSVMDRFYPLKESNDYNVMTHLLETINTGWFHGDMERKGAEERLKGRETGTFLVRISNTIRFNFTISKVDKDGRITHQRIEFHPKKGFSIIVRSKESNQKSVIHSQEDSLPEFVSRLKQPLSLLVPCPGSLMDQFSKDTGLASCYLQGTDYY